MIFVPSRGGISHAPAEYTDPDAIMRGIRTLAAAWVAAYNPSMPGQA